MAMKVMHCGHCEGTGMVKENTWDSLPPGQTPPFEAKKICMLCGGTGHIVSEG